MRRLAIVLGILAAAACAPPSPADPGIAERFSGDAASDPMLRRLIILETEAYWSDVRRGKWETAYQRFTDDYQAGTSYVEWRNMPHDVWPGRPRILSIHWTKGAHRQHGSELYAIVEWTARRASAGSEGALIWRQQPDGSFLLENTIIRPLVRPKT